MTDSLENYGAIFWCPPDVEDHVQNWTINHIHEGTLDECKSTTLCGEQIGDPYQDNSMDAGLFCEACCAVLESRGIYLPSRSMGYEKILLPIQWKTGEHNGRINRYTHVSKCGRIKLVPERCNGDLVWRIVIDEIDLNWTHPTLTRQKSYVHRHLLRADQMPLEDGTVVWVYFEGGSGHRRLQGVRFSHDKNVDDMARKAAGLMSKVKVHRRVVSPRQNRLD